MVVPLALALAVFPDFSLLFVTLLRVSVVIVGRSVAEGSDTLFTYSTDALPLAALTSSKHSNWNSDNGFS